MIPIQTGGVSRMPICLYEHNKHAYASVRAMLSKTGKAAVIHPTGTGKSFIGFKLCEEHPDKKICWLSPSKYIFATQLENLANASEGYRPENVEFITLILPHYPKITALDCLRFSRLGVHYNFLSISYPFLWKRSIGCQFLEW